MNGWDPTAQPSSSAKQEHTFLSSVTVFVRSNSGAVESTHEKESKEDEKHPHSKDMIGPPPVKVLLNTDR